ncbi:MAG: hypothetical protein A3K66_06370 [Euryarchaeota archaeon RBG_16_67_27]|nr:MAG: hypothetical protein A3K66_06370 [Euryarchaeota archaeon RBG_16_67_27]
MNRMYVSFLHSLCGSEYQVFVHHIVPGMKGEALADLVRRLERLEPSTQLTVLSKQDVRRMGFRARGAPYRELTLATRTRETLEILFEYGYMYIGFEEWLLGRVDSAFPLEFLRRTCFEREVTALLQSAVRDFPATIQIREFHGPLVATTYLSEERVFSAANQTASELGYILRVE